MALDPRRWATVQQLFHQAVGLPVVRAVSDPTVSWLRAARGDLAQVYDATDRPDDARLLREEEARTDSLATAAAR